MPITRWQSFGMPTDVLRQHLFSSQTTLGVTDHAWPRVSGELFCCRRRIVFLILSSSRSWLLMLVNCLVPSCNWVLPTQKGY